MNLLNSNHDVERIIFNAEEIKAKVKSIADIINTRFKGTRPVVACVLKGASIFYADLCRELEMDIDMDYISVSSYGNNSKSSGIVKLTKDLDFEITGRNFIIVEDIIDSGLTIKYLRKMFQTRKPKSITTVSMLVKEENISNNDVDIYGFIAPNDFIVGYGLDYANHYRNLPYIGVLKPECYNDIGKES